MIQTKVVASILAVAGFALAAHGQGNLQIQVSPAGQELWTNNIQTTPGTALDVRVRLSYTGTAAPIGLASAYFQPTISNWRNTGTTDSLSALVNGGQGSNTSTPVGGVPDAAGQYGRILPYANRATNGSQALTGFVQAISSTTYLRIAQAYATDWIGTGFNQTGGRGIPISQVNNVGRTTAEPAFAAALQNIVIFKFRINLSTDVTAQRVLYIDIPQAGLGNLNDATGVREIRWFANMTESTGSIVGGATVTPAVVVVPAPAGTALLGLAGLTAVRRKRR